MTGRRSPHCPAWDRTTRRSSRTATRPARPRTSPRRARCSSARWSSCRPTARRSRPTTARRRRPTPRTVGETATPASERVDPRPPAGKGEAGAAVLPAGATRAAAPVPAADPATAASDGARARQDTTSAPAEPAADPAPAASDGARAQQDTTSAPAVAFEGADAVPRALQVVGSIVAPTTLLTALFIYFGLMYAVGYCRYSGVTYTALDLPTQGFLMVSPNSATVPLVLLAAGGLLALSLYRLPVERSSGVVRRLLIRVWLPLVVLTGVVLVGLVAITAVFRRSVFPATFPEARGLSLSIGVVLLAYATHLRRALTTRASARSDHPGATTPVALTVATWVCVAVLFGVGLFWAVGSYAIRMGDQDGARHAAGLHCAPDVVLYSAQSLDLQSAGVPEEPATTADGAYRFRYPGLKLVPQAGNQYLLLPADWVPGSRPAILLPRSDSLRLEFVRVTAPVPGAC